MEKIMRPFIVLLAAAGLAARATLAQDFQPQPPPAAQPPVYSSPSSPVYSPAGPPVYNPPSSPVYNAPSPAVNNSQNEFTIGGWLAGASVYYLVPKWSSNPAYSTLNNNANTNVTTGAEQDFTMNGGFAPLVYLGFMSDAGIGIRARWWQFSESSSTTVSQAATTANPPPTSTVFSDYPLGLGFGSPVANGYSNVMEFDSSLTIDVADVELIWDVRGGGWSMLFGAGLRYAHINQNYNATWTSSVSPADPTQDAYITTVQSGHNFDGLGPVVSLEGRYPLGRSGFAILANARGALLFGSGTQSALYDSVDTQGQMAPSPIQRSQSSGGVMPMAELELGAEWSHALGLARIAIQGAVVGQAWLFAGNASDQDFTFGGSSTSTQDPLGLVGFRLSAALSY
jgi:hypothetical protein